MGNRHRLPFTYKHLSTLSLSYSADAVRYDVFAIVLFLLPLPVDLPIVGARIVVRGITYAAAVANLVASVAPVASLHIILPTSNTNTKHQQKRKER